MGKKVKKKTRNTAQERRVSSVSHGSTPKQSKPPAEVVIDEGAVVVKERKPCVHVEKCVDLSKFSAKIESNEAVKCEDCREGAIGRREHKGRSKHGKKRGLGVGARKESKKCVWVCLECGHFACGGVGLPTTPDSHALRHAKQARHPLVVQFENPNLCWCFPCSLLVPVGKLEQDDEQKDVLLEAMKLIKGKPSEGASVDVEEVWFRTGSILGEVKSEASNLETLDGKGDYMVRGLVNLGNTCFFNAIMQNILAMSQLRDYFMKLDRSAGPLTMSLKKLFNETSLEAESRSGISPKALFGCICAKAPQFRGYQQQDSHELLRYLLDGLCTEEVSSRKLLSDLDDGATSNLGPTFVDTIFGGQLSSTVSCVECRHSSVVYEPFLDLSLPVPTKKPRPKKASAISRSKRTKLLLKKEVKKGGKVRGKGKTGLPQVLSESLTSQPESKDSSLTSQPESEGPSLTSKPESKDPSLTSSKDPSVTSQQESNDPSSRASSSLPLKEETIDSSETWAWMDYVGSDITPDGFDYVSHDHDISAIQGSESKGVSQNGGMLQTSIDENDQVSTQSGAPDLNVSESEGNSYENDLPLQVQDSEVILLPYNKGNLITDEIVSKESEASTSVVDFGQDALDFDGFGDMFNEPEVVSVPNTVSLSDETNLTGKDMAVIGCLPGNSSESDPDEVDNTDAPVSIDSCLSYFTKPELLSKHAWHCENCSKILWEQKVQARENQKKTILKKQRNGGQCRNHDDPSDFDTGFGSLDLDNCESDIISSAASEKLVSDPKELGDSQENHVNGEICTSDEVNSSKLHIASSCQENHTEVSQSDCSFLHSDYSPQVGSSSGSSRQPRKNEPECLGRNVNQVQSRDYQVAPGVDKVDDIEEVDSKCKVMRDATKRILINKAPTILTIHLKRFSQDARGRLSKLSGHVNFLETIDLSPYVDTRSNVKTKYDYRLIGIVEHSGTMRGGHYVAYVRGNANRGKTNTDTGDSKWFYASDTHVREVSLSEVFRCEAYILFYERV